MKKNEYRVDFFNEFFFYDFLLSEKFSCSLTLSVVKKLMKLVLFLPLHRDISSYTPISKSSYFSFDTKFIWNCRYFHYFGSEKTQK